jgi:hypothetical protein
MSRGLGYIERAVLAIIEDDDATDDDYYAAEDLADRIYPKPKRIQIERDKKGWKTPPNTVNVTRQGHWKGKYRNPFKVEDYGLEEALRLFRESWIGKDLTELRADLRRKNLACRCPLSQPCHADILLELANGPKWWWPTRAERLVVLRAMHSLVRKYPDRFTLTGGKGREHLWIGTHKAIAKLEAN